MGEGAAVGGGSAVAESLRLITISLVGSGLGVPAALGVLAAESGAGETPFSLSSLARRSGSVVKRAPVFRLAGFFSVVVEAVDQLLVRGRGTRLP